MICSPPRLASAFPTPSALVVPLIAAERWYGAVILGFEQRRTFRPEEIALAEQAGALVALAMAKLEAIDSERGRAATLAGAATGEPGGDLPAGTGRRASICS